MLIIKQVKSKLIKGNVILAKVRHYIPQNLLVNTYNAHIQPHIDYGQNIWGHAANVHLEDIVRQQKKSVRIINFKNKHHETTPLFKQTKILPVDCNRKFNSGKFLWKINNSLCPSLNSLFTKRQHDDSFHVPHRRLDVSQNSITYDSVKTWNAIPSQIKSCSSINLFKTKYKEYLLNKL